MMLHPDSLFPVEPSVRALTRRLYDSVKTQPIISPHGHTDPAWFADNTPFSDPVDLFITYDHYLFRMLYSQGIKLEALGISGNLCSTVATDKRAIWRKFCENYHLFRGTPSRFWLDHSLYEVCDVNLPVNAEHADALYDTLMARLQDASFKPRQLLDKFNIEYLATTDSPLDDLAAHQTIFQSALKGRVVPTYRPDAVIDPLHENFHANLEHFAEITKEDVASFQGYLQAHRKRRQDFIELGASASDHGHPTARTADLSASEAEALYQKILRGDFNAEEAELFRAQMLTEMAKMSLEDGLVMQLHPGSYRNHNQMLFDKFGRDKGADIPVAIEFVQALRPLLNRLGNEKDLTLILFTLDESTYARELAPLAGHYPALKLGPAWWFFDSVEGMRRYKSHVYETAGFYNTVGFNDDTRALLSIPARHDMARRIDCGHLASLVAEHRLQEEEAFELALLLSGQLAKQNYRLV